jgi:ATP-dependent Lon protease
LLRSILVKRATESHGLKEYPVNIKDKVFMKIISGYTKEAGVRDLERHMNTIARKLQLMLFRMMLKKVRSITLRLNK